MGGREASGALSLLTDAMRHRDTDIADIVEGVFRSLDAAIGLYNVREARARFSDLIHRAREGGPQLVRRVQPGEDEEPLVLISVNELYELMKAAADSQSLSVGDLFAPTEAFPAIDNPLEVRRLDEAPRPFAL